MLKIYRIKLAALCLLLVGTLAVLLAGNTFNRTVHAFSAGPPAGYTHAPGEFDCAECHVVTNTGTGRIVVEAPQNYVPGQTYNLTVRHTNADPSRTRWGFQLTALDAGDERAGTLEATDDTTQVLDNQGPFPARQYIEHSSTGTFPGKLDGASWTFRWTAPASDVGPITFYAAGNHANGDGNTSGDNIYYTFSTAQPAAPAPDFAVSVTPSARTIQQGGGTTYTVTVTPEAGFKGQVNLSIAGLPQGAAASFQPSTLNITDSSAQSSTLSVSTAGNTTKGGFNLNVSATSGSLSHSAQAFLNVVGAGDADLSVSQSVSPNPAQAGESLTFTITVRNNGPVTATGVNTVVRFPLNSGSFSKGKGTCTLIPGAAEINYYCVYPNLTAGASDTIDFTVRPPAPGTFNSAAVVQGNEHDPLPANNTSSVATPVLAKSNNPSMTVTNLGVRIVAAGFDMPTALAFLGPDDLLVLEKATGRVLRVSNGKIVSVALDLAVNNASERGLLGIALHPNFAVNKYVYLYWTESGTGADASATNDVPLLGNRVDRFVWNDSTLSFDRNLIRLRAFQADANQPARGNHNGGVLRFGPDGKLYVVVGDEGRRGLLQNLAGGGPIPDDQFGGPEPDDAHLTGVILRLNDDGTTPADNPFFNAVTSLNGEAAANVKKIFAYGIRNSFGMDFDPATGSLWTQENGDDSFDEINRVDAGFNGGWIQLMGPSSRIAQFKEIEVNRAGGLQQLRWSPTLIADTPAQALARLYMLPGAHYAEPKFSWKYAVAPSPVGFAKGTGLGAQYAGDLFVGASRTTLLGGYLFRLKLSDDRKEIVSDDSRLSDGVADNLDKFDIGESESLLVGRDFGVTTDIRTSPAGSLYIVSLSNGAIYEVFARPTLFVANLSGAQEAPPTDSPARGTATLLLDKDETTARVSLNFDGLSAPQTGAHIHGPAEPGKNAAVIFELPRGNFNDYQINLTPGQVRDLKAGLLYINIHSSAHPAGEIRAQFGTVAASSIVQFNPLNESVPEGARIATVTVNRMGDVSGAQSVDYTTSDGTASERGDYTTARGTLRFAPGERFKTFDVLLTDDAFTEGIETINLTLSNPSNGAGLGNRSVAVLNINDNDTAPAVVNPIDDTQFFVRSHYADFLNREPDAAGLAHWTSEIESCGANAQCREVKRINVSAAFFLSIEFQQTGYYVYRFYEASYDRQPRYLEFLPDTQEAGRGVVVGANNWEAQLDARKREFAERWVERPAFKSIYDNLSNAQYVDKLFANTGTVPAPIVRDTLVAGLDGGTETRAGVLRKIVEEPDFARFEFRRAFVLMQYFGYLRRNPDDAPDNNSGGYNFWLSKLNQFGGNFIEAEMVKAFISSDEYRRRFGPQ